MNLETAKAKIQQAEMDIAGIKLPVKIESLEQVKQVTRYRDSAHTQLRDLEARRTEITKPLNDSLKSVNALFKGAKDALDQIKKSANRLLKVYDSEQAEIKRKAEQEATEKAEEEKKRLLAEAEKKTKAGGIENLVAAKELETASNNVSAEVVFVPIPKIDGRMIRRTYGAVVIDLKELDRKYMTPDMKVLNELARTSKGDSSLAPAGVEFREKL